MSHDIEMHRIDQQIPATKACEHDTRCPLCYYENIQITLDAILCVIDSIAAEQKADFKRHHDPQIQVGYLTPVVEPPDPPQ